MAEKTKKPRILKVRPAGMSDEAWARNRQRFVRWVRRRPGWSWRFLCQGTKRSEYFTTNSDETAAPFDELVVDDWFHIEQMDTRTWWMRVGDCDFWITVPRNGPARISLTEGKLHEPK